MTDECRRLQNTRYNKILIEQINPNLTYSSVNAITRLRVQKLRILETTHNNSTNGCWLCGDWHYVRLSAFKEHEFQMCNKRRHKEGYCPTNHIS
ncbi:unnamed protein product [Schistosoma mattheei]|uniref:Uncharacterized protein n=1 Tax=Schistosoma mattheei TaxID=31246 RepID=A0AA85BN45_9TREM|nr:unnamed protein product [Schistosoma mattheei]